MEEDGRNKLHNLGKSWPIHEVQIEKWSVDIARKLLRKIWTIMFNTFWVTADWNTIQCNLYGRIICIILGKPWATHEFQIGKWSVPIAHNISYNFWSQKQVIYDIAYQIILVFHIITPIDSYILFEITITIYFSRII